MSYVVTDADIAAADKMFIKNIENNYLKNFKEQEKQLILESLKSNSILKHIGAMLQIFGAPFISEKIQTTLATYGTKFVLTSSLILSIYSTLGYFFLQGFRTYYYFLIIFIITLTVIYVVFKMISKRITDNLPNVFSGYITEMSSKKMSGKD